MQHSAILLPWALHYGNSLSILATVEVLDILRIIQYSEELSVILILIAFKIQSLMSYGEENQAKIHKNLKEETSFETNFYGLAKQKSASIKRWKKRKCGWKKEKETAHDLICQSGYQWNWQLLMISLLNEVADRIQKCTGGFCLCFQPEA